MAVTVVAAVAPPRAPTKLRVMIGTLHAAALTTARSAADSVDEPYFLVSVLGPHADRAVLQLPNAGHLRIRENEALGARPLADVGVAPGDTVRVLVSVLEGPAGHAGR